jgi:hypothetical protein
MKLPQVNLRDLINKSSNSYSLFSARRKNQDFSLRSRKTKILTTGILLVVFRGLKFESDPKEIGFAFHRSGADIGEKDGFRSGTI